MRSTRATVAALEQRVVALELRLGAAGVGVYRSDAPSPQHSVYAPSPAREDPYTAREDPYPAREELHSAREDPYPAALERDDPCQGNGHIDEGALLYRSLCSQLLARLDLNYGDTPNVSLLFKPA